MKQHQRFFTLLFCLFFSYASFSQNCNPTENWLSTGFPEDGARQMTEMNGNLYTVDFNVPRQEYVLFMYDGFQWTEMSAIPVGGVNYSLEAFQNQIYLGGTFHASNLQIPNTTGIIRWDSLTNAWSEVSGGIGGYVFDMEVYQNELYVAGTFDSVGGNLPVNSIAKWDGTTWDTLTQQNLITALNTNNQPSFQVLHTWNNKLIIGGHFQIQGNEHLAQWDNTGFTNFPDYPDRAAEEIGVYNGDLIIYGPYIDFIGTQAFNQIARWDGMAWQTMGMASNDFVDLSHFQEYQGDLYATGPNSNYKIGGGLIFDGMARWDGTQWHLVTGFDGYGYELVIYQNRLFLSGRFNSSCNAPMNDVVKLCTAFECQAVSGTIFQDDNGNCTQETGEFGLNQQWVNIQPGNYLIPTDSLGDYYLLIDTGAYSITTPSLPTYYTASCPVNGYSGTLNASTNGATNLNFGLTPQPNVQDLQVSLTTFFFRPGFISRIYVNYTNNGTIPQVADIDLVRDPTLSYSGIASIPVTSQTPSTLSWLVGNLNPSQGGGLWAEVTVPVTAVLGDTTCVSAHVNPVAGDMTPPNNSDTVKSIITGSFDPNDKRVEPAGEGENGDIPLETKMLTYTIRFQNTGTDTAFTVVIRDEIDEDLDLATLQTLGASHGWSFEVEEERRIKWTFNNILLPDSNINEPASHGFVSYSIKLKENLPLETRIENEAAIYFDFNSPIITNRTVNTLTEDNTSISKLANLNQLEIWPQPARDWINFESETPIINGVLHLYDLQGRQVAITTNLQGRRFQIPVGTLTAGVYAFRLTAAKGVAASGKLMIE